MTEHEHATNADETAIRWLFEESGVSRYQISKEVGISEATLSRMAREVTTLESMRFGHAQKLTAYAAKLQGQQARQEDDTHGER